MEKTNSSKGQLLLSKQSSTYIYESGIEHFFISRRNEGKITEIVAFLPFADKMKVFKLSRNFFRIVKREIDFKEADEVLTDLGKLDLDELNIKEIYNIISVYYKEPSRDEKFHQGYTENMISFCAAMLNKKFLEPGRFIKNYKNLKEEDLRHFNKYFQQYREEWDFYKGKLDKFGLKIVANSLTFNKSLKSLLIHGCSFDDADLEYLLLFLTKGKNETLESLDLMYNDITDKGCKYLRDYLYHNDHLKSLYIGVNKKITSMGIQFISYGLVGNTNLKLLNCQALNLDDSHSDVINNFLVHNKGLETLEIPNNKFTLKAIEDWKLGLETNKNLTELNLSGNKIGDEGAILLAKILNCSNLTKIDLRANDLTKKCYNELYSASEKNSKIKSLDLFANFDNDKSLIEKINIMLQKRRNDM